MLYQLSYSSIEQGNYIISPGIVQEAVAQGHSPVNGQLSMVHNNDVLRRFNVNTVQTCGQTTSGTNVVGARQGHALPGLRFYPCKKFACKFFPSAIDH